MGAITFTTQTAVLFPAFEAFAVIFTSPVPTAVTTALKGSAGSALTVAIFWLADVHTTVLSDVVSAGSKLTCKTAVETFSAFSCALKFFVSSTTVSGLRRVTVSLSSVIPCNGAFTVTLQETSTVW